MSNDASYIVAIEMLAVYYKDFADLDDNEIESELEHETTIYRDLAQQLIDNKETTNEQG